SRLRSNLVRSVSLLAAGCGLALVFSANAQGQGGAAAAPDTIYDRVNPLVSRLDLEKYKNTIKGLARFGDRRQGTKRNRDAVDWIEAQLKSYGCTNTERVKYTYNPPPQTPRATDSVAAARARAARGNQAQGGGRMFGNRARTG